MEEVTLTASKIGFQVISPCSINGKHSIYMDIVNLPSTVQFGVTIKAYNTDNVNLYFKITGAATGYTFTTVNLGIVNSGSNIQQNLDQFVSRSKPSSGDLPNGELTETITLTLLGYTDSGYTNLKWTYNRSIHVYWINSADAAFTTDFLDNFDDGTVQGWAAVVEAGTGNSATIDIVSDYVLSASYAARLRNCKGLASEEESRVRMYKSFTTPAKSKIYAIIHIRNAWTGIVSYLKYIKVSYGTTLLINLGTVFNTGYSHSFPVNKWVRIVVPLPASTTLEMRIAQSMLPAASPTCMNTWFDDFKIISK